MAELNLKYYDGNNHYSDGPIEEYLLRYIEGKHLDTSNLSLQDRYAMFYHLSPLRQNILRWFPFKEECSILEIGSGCGALTGLLCQKAKMVTCVELSYRRSEINLKRNKDKNNLEIYVGNISNVHFTQQFDYIILNGVLEYAGGFTDSNKPYESFLENVSHYLKASGALLLAIENRLGIKYFSGSSEDHTNNYFLSLNQYKGNCKVKTFSKTELISLLKGAGYTNNTFYYPYPDYKFPIEIYSDSTINSGQYGRRISNVEKEKIKLFDEKRVMDSFALEQTMDKFANSFLITATRDEDTPKQIIDYVKLNTTRKAKYRIDTIILENNGVKQVVKSVQSTQAIEHLQNIHRFEKHNQERGNYLQGKLSDNRLIYPYLSSKSLDREILDFIHQNDIKSIKKSIHELFEFLLKESNFEELEFTEQFKTFFGDTKIIREFNVVKNHNIDLICDNIYRIKNSYLFIDREWVCPFAVPVEFIIWRLINELFNKYEELNDFICLSRFLEEFNINAECHDVFRDWANYFAEQYVSDGSLVSFKGNEYLLSLDEWIQDCRRPKQFETTLYIDTGIGFNEQEKITISAAILSNQSFDIQFDLSGYSDIKALRWDPVENEACSCKIVECLWGVSKISYQPLNNTPEEESLFLTPDPQIMLLINSEESKQILRIRGNLQFIDAKLLLNHMYQGQEELKMEAFQCKALVKEYSDEIDELKRELRIVNAAKNSYRNDTFKYIEISQTYKKQNISLLEENGKRDIDIAILKNEIEKANAEKERAQISLQTDKKNVNSRIGKRVINMLLKGRK